jgi:type II secretory pathway pseudopilin PulG
MRTPAATRAQRHGHGRRACASQGGYAMAALLVAIGVLGIVMSAAMPAWQTAARREREAELVFRGEQYARAIQLFQRKYANTLPPSLEVLINEKFLRKKYVDPITNGEFQLLGAAQAAGATATQTPGRGQGPSSQPQGRAQSAASTSSPSTTALNDLARQTGGRPGGPGRGAPGLGAVGGGIMGVTSKSAEKSLRLYNGRGAYNEWAFVPVQRVNNPGDTGGAGGAAGARGRGAPPNDGRSGNNGFRPAQGSGARGNLDRPQGGIRPPTEGPTRGR